MSRLLRGRGFTLVELLVVVIILAILISVLLPMLSNARRAAVQSKLEAQQANHYATRAPAVAAAPAAASAAEYADAEAPPAAAMMGAAGSHGPPPAPARPLASVTSFDADIALTPRLSVGTAEPESIYEARFGGKLEATIARPASAAGDAAAAAEHELQLPLPPQIISLADLTVTVDGVPSDAVELRGDKLVWHGVLPASGSPAKVDVTYSAVGKGLYALHTPPGEILDRFRIELTANGSDVQMLELSLQPTGLAQSSGTTTYTWDYTRLMFGRPIALDVLGVAPLDRLGELRWLGPMSVVVFGLVVGLVAHAWDVRRFDRWMLMLVLGTFAGAYPLMYFAQEFVPLDAAMLGAGALVVLVIGARTVTVMGVRLALAGVVLLAAAVMAVTLTAAVRPHLQGILLTGLALAVFALAMLLAPRLKGFSVPAQPREAATPALG